MRKRVITLYNVYLSAIFNVSKKFIFIHPEQK